MFKIDYRDIENRKCNPVEFTVLKMTRIRYRGFIA